MSEDLYDIGSAVVGLYRLFTNFFEIPWGIPRTGWIHWGGGGGGGGCPWDHRTFPSCSSFHTSSIKTITSLYLKLVKKHLITLSAHTFFYNCSVKIILCSNCSLIYVLYSNIES